MWLVLHWVQVIYEWLLLLLLELLLGLASQATLFHVFTQNLVFNHLFSDGCDGVVHDRNTLGQLQHLRLALRISFFDFVIHLLNLLVDLLGIDLVDLVLVYLLDELFQGRLLLYQWIETVPDIYELVHQLAVVILGRLVFKALLHFGLQRKDFQLLFDLRILLTLEFFDQIAHLILKDAPLMAQVNLVQARVL